MGINKDQQRAIITHNIHSLWNGGWSMGIVDCLNCDVQVNQISDCTIIIITIILTPHEPE